LKMGIHRGVRHSVFGQFYNVINWRTRICTAGSHLQLEITPPQKCRRDRPQYP
jgi:hypothetical protein